MNSTTTASSLKTYRATRRPLNRPLWETILDKAISLTALILLSPFLVFIALYIKTVSSGPIFFRQRRIGHKGCSFTIYKFRTMHPNANTSEHENHTAELIHSDAPMIKLDNRGDKRLIPFGKLLRAAGIDEIPQLFNVLRGEMSVAGPRPCLPSEYAQYTTREEKRFDTLPGLTGLWQVSGKNRLTFSQMIDCDIRYVNDKSLKLYLTILLKTPFVLLNQILESRRTPMLARMPAPSTMATRLEKEAVGQ